MRCRSIQTRSQSIPTKNLQQEILRLVGDVAVTRNHTWQNQAQGSIHIRLIGAQLIQVQGSGSIACLVKMLHHGHIMLT